MPRKATVPKKPALRLLTIDDDPKLAVEMGVRPAQSTVDAKAERKRLMGMIGGELGELKGFLFGNHVMVAKWIRERASANILAPEQTRREDGWQGKIGLVVALGPSAFVDDANYSFHGMNVSVGDWVWYSSNDGLDQDYVPPGTLARVPLRTLRDVDIIGRVPRPDFFF